MDDKRVAEIAAVVCKKKHGRTTGCHVCRKQTVEVLEALQVSDG